MALIRQYKRSSLPASLVANALYFIRKGSFFDLFATNSGGTVVATPVLLTQAARQDVSPSITDQTISNTLSKINGSTLFFRTGELKPKAVIRWHVSGITSGGNATSTLAIRCGPNNDNTDPVIASFSLPAAASGDNNPFSLTIEATVRAVGATANVRASGRITKNGIAGIGGGFLTTVLLGVVTPPSFELPSPSISNFNSNGNRYLNLSFQTSNANTSATVQQCWAEIVYPGD